jgi:hypothetical protein
MKPSYPARNWTLSYASLIQSTPSYQLQALPHGLFSSDFPAKFVYIWHVFHVCYMIWIFYIHCLDHHNQVLWREKVINVIVKQFSLLSVSASYYRFKYSPQASPLYTSTCKLFMFPFYINVFQRCIKLYLFIPFQFSLKINIKKFTVNV